MAFPNLYYKRTAATAKACYVCYKPTATVLATIDTADFLYTCPVHLTDPGFATRAPDPEPSPNKPTDDEIARTKKEWEEKQQLKKEKEKEREEEADGAKRGADKDAEGKEADGETKAGGKQDKKPATTHAPKDEPHRPTHERYVLHRNIFALRTADHRRRRQAAQTKALAPRLPGAPTSQLP